MWADRPPGASTKQPARVPHKDHKKNMSIQITLRNRLQEHVGAVAEAETIVFDPDAPSTPRIEAKPIAFNGMQRQRSARSRTLC